MKGIVVLIATAGLAVAASPASADSNGPYGPIGFDQQVTTIGYSWSLTGVPDIDQVRGTNQALGKQGLPNNGLMWCVPTSSMDVLAYLADMGYDTGVASKDWTLPDNYNEMSAELLELGTAMGADPAKGCCSGTNYQDTMTARLTAAGSQQQGTELPGIFQYVSYTLGDWTGASAQQMAFAGLDGALTTPVIGFYADEDDPDGTGIVKRRVGGHVMAGVGASGAYISPDATVQVRDPATQYVIKTTQTPYATDPHAVSEATYKFIWKSGNTDQTGTSTVGKWDGSESTLWEGYGKIVPNTTWVSIFDKLARIRAYEVVPPGPDPGPLRKVFELPGQAAVSSLALSAATPAPAFLLKGSDKVMTLDPVTGSSAQLGRVAGARALVFGGESQDLFVAGQRKLVALDGITGETLGSERLAKPLAALAFDEEAGVLAGINGDGKLQLFDDELRNQGARVVKGISGDGKPLLAVAPNGGLLLGSSASPAVLSAKPVAKLAATKRATRPPIKPDRLFRAGDDLGGLVVDELGHILVAVDGRLRVFDRKGDVLENSRFTGRANAALAVTRSFSNADPELLQPAIDFWPFDPPVEPPPELPDLVADMVSSTELRVRNVGAGAAGPFKVRVTPATGGPPTDFDVGGLAPGAETLLPVSCGRGSAAVDFTAAVQETDEGNNTAPTDCP